MGMPMGTAVGSSPTALRMSARTCALVRFSAEPTDGGPQPKRISVSSAARAMLCIVLSGDERASSESIMRRASSRRSGVRQPRASSRMMEWTDRGSESGTGTGTAGTVGCASRADRPCDWWDLRHCRHKIRRGHRGVTCRPACAVCPAQRRRAIGAQPSERSPAQHGHHGAGGVRREPGRHRPCAGRRRRSKRERVSSLHRCLASGSSSYTECSLSSEQSDSSE